VVVTVKANQFSMYEEELELSIEDEELESIEDEELELSKDEELELSNELLELLSLGIINPI